MGVDSETWNKFRNHARARQQLSNSTIEETIRKLKHLEKHGVNLMGDREEIENQMYDFFAYKIERGSSNSALNHYVKAINRWFKFRGLELKLPQYKERYAPRRIPTTEDINKLLKTCSRRTKIDKRDKTIIYTLATLGLRASELCNLNLDDIDWVHRLLRVKGKGGKIRYIPIPQKLLDGRTYPSFKNYIKKWRMNTDKKALFTTQQGRLTPVRLRTIIKKRARMAKIPWIHPHSLRHYAATNWLRAGLNIRVVQELLGHESIETTGIYLHIVETDLLNALENERIDDPLRVKPRHPKNQWLLTKSYLLFSVIPSGP